MDLQSLEEKTIKRTEIFDGTIVKLVVDDVELPDGNLATRELVLHRGAVAIMAVDELNRMLFVYQYRKPLEKVTLEIPAGRINLGEEHTPLATAKRELEEETDFQAEIWEETTGMYSTPGFSNEYLFMYWAEKLYKSEQPLPTDEDEFLFFQALTLKEAKQAIIDGYICDAKTIYAVTYWELRTLQRGGD